MKRKIFITTIIIIGSVVALFFYPLRSYLVMSVSTVVEQNKSIMAQKDFDIKLRGGWETSQKDWYPFVMLFNDNGFKRYSGENADLSILYNFGAFSRSQSTIYDEDSEYYSAFYGAYVINSDSFGLTDGELNLEELFKVMEYDYSKLVIRDIGCPNPTFTINDGVKSEIVPYIDIDGWTRADASIMTNGISHELQEFKLGYLQYGNPPATANEDFPIIEIQGRIYAKYFTEYDAIVVLYMMAKDASVIDECDEMILSKTVIE